MSKIVLDLNPSRCVCCYACVVACLDQHYNIDESGPPLRRAVRIESKEGKISCVSVGCMHCADAPCMVACPTGAIYRDEETGLVQVQSSRCVGCRKCRRVCTFGAPQFTEEKKMVKCDGCLERVRRGLLPVCVQTCPSGALSVREEDDPERTERVRRLLAGEEL